MGGYKFPDWHSICQNSEKVTLMMLYVQDHSANKSSSCTINAGSSSIPGNASLMVEWEYGSFDCRPKLKQCWWELKAFRPVREGAIFRHSVHRKQTQQVALDTLPFIGKLDEVQETILFFHEHGRRVGMVPRSSLKEGKNRQMVEKGTKTPKPTQTKHPSPQAESPPSCSLSSTLGETCETETSGN